MTALLREPLYRVEITSRDASLPGTAIVEKLAIKEAAERTAAKINDLEGPVIATIRQTRWRLILAA